VGDGCGEGKTGEKGEGERRWVGVKGVVHAVFA